ncbi:MAG: acyl carrier protein [Anaerolineae bacterium]|nr:acyl carrier protein [Anaerolineae bacterium]
MTSKPDGNMSFDEFRGFLSDTLGVAEATLDADTHFLSDLAVDSLKMVELMLQFELQLGRKVSADAAWDILTVGDAYKFYQRQAGVAPA